MEEASRIKIAVITEDKNLKEYIESILEAEDYEIKAYAGQKEALLSLEKDSPDLVISDFQSPNINGLNLCKSLRKIFLFRYTPIIFLLSDTESLNIAKLIYAGADDYMQKSSLKEGDLVLKVKANLYRTARQQDINTLTRLPGQFNLSRELQKRIESKAVFAVCRADLYNLKDFNQRYGFKKGDEVIKYASSLILKTLNEMGSPSDFLSHPQSDDFFFLTSCESAEAIVNKIIKAFDSEIASFYDKEDKKRGCIFLKNRKGEIQQIPFLRIYIGIVTNEDYSFFSPIQVIQIVSELMTFAQKNSEKSFYAKERRKTYPFY